LGGSTFGVLKEKKKKKDRTSTEEQPIHSAQEGKNPGPPVDAERKRKKKKKSATKKNVRQPPKGVTLKERKTKGKTDRLTNLGASHTLKRVWGNKDRA